MEQFRYFMFIFMIFFKLQHLKIAVRIILEVTRFDWYVHKGYINTTFVYNHED